MYNTIFDQKLFLGFVNKVNIDITSVHIPSSKNLNKFVYFGNEHQGGLINSLVVIEGENVGFIGKIISSEILEKERYDITQNNLNKIDMHPIIKVEILSSFDYYDVVFLKTICNYPNLGAKVYMASKNIVDKFFKNTEFKIYNKKTINFSYVLNTNTNDYSNHLLDLSLQNLFDRHAAIIGTTGSGKSWTTAKLVENLLNNDIKVILLDATGEYKNLAMKYSDEKKAQLIDLSKEDFISYKKLKFSDLMYLVQPSEGVQRPKLMEAIRSLKLLEKHEDELKDYVSCIGNHKVLNKMLLNKEIFIQVYNKYYNEINSDDLDFDIYSLSKQVENECIYDSDPKKFGGKDERTLGYCSYMISRINGLLNNMAYSELFDFDNMKQVIYDDLFEKIDNFIIKNNNIKFLSIDLGTLPYQYSIRDIVANSIGQNLLDKARSSNLKNNPLILIVDEAHQFLNKKLSENDVIYSLDSFDNIAKEGRKYGLFLCLTTQRPRDIPLGTISQIGTFIVHRLINTQDKEIVISALSNVNKQITNYLAELGEGEAILSSVNLKLPLLIKVLEPNIKPDSDTPKL